MGLTVESVCLKFASRVYMYLMYYACYACMACRWMMFVHKFLHYSKEARKTLRPWRCGMEARRGCKTVRSCLQPARQLEWSSRRTRHPSVCDRIVLKIHKYCTCNMCVLCVKYSIPYTVVTVTQVTQQDPGIKRVNLEEMMRILKIFLSEPWILSVKG